MNKSISLCMIIKDEAEQLKRCLASVKEVVDELIIVDTGSRDQSLDICRQFGAKVLSYEWTDHFADARNYGLQFARCDWILWMDADEKMDLKQMNLTQFLNNTNADVLSIPVINYYGEGEPVNPQNAFVLSQYRLFKNHAELRFKQNIHEYLQINDSNRIDHLLESEACIHHYGYLTNAVELKNKSLRNLTILKRNLNASDQDPWVYFHIANELQSIKAYELSVDFINASILGFLKNGQKPPAILYRLKYEILIRTDRYDEAWPGIEKAIELYPDYVDLYYLKGLILFAKNAYEESMNAFKHCLTLGESHPEYLILKGAGSFKAKEKLEQCSEKMKFNG